MSARAAVRRALIVTVCVVCVSVRIEREREDGDGEKERKMDTCKDVFIETELADICSLSTAVS